METQVNKTEMTNPPKHSTKMVEPQKKGQATYKVFILQPTMIGGVSYGEKGQIIDETSVVQPGKIIEVDKKTAKDLCKKIWGSYAFSGERHNADKDCPRHDLTRARLAVPGDLVDSKPLTPFTTDEIFED